MKRQLAICIGACASWVVIGAAIAPVVRADGFGDDVLSTRHEVGSPEHFALELRVGPYTPQVGNSSFSETFGSASGPMLATEFDVLPFRIPYFGLIGVGEGLGWVHYSTGAFISGSNDCASEKTTLTLFPLSTMGVVRVDVFARRLNIPLILTGKVGLDSVFWSTNKGTSSQASGTSLGLRWGIQVAFELDFFDCRAARGLDEEWGINHTWVFAEIYHSDAGATSLHVGDTSWAAGLGMNF